MSQDNTTAPVRVWHDSAHASLCVLGSYLRRTDFFAPLERQLQMHQKTLKYTVVCENTIHAIFLLPVLATFIIWLKNEQRSSL